MKPQPPRWADRFLKWYCRPDLLEEIQGDAYELYSRRAKSSKFNADFHFVWNVLRFFRLRNIKKSRQSSSLLTIDMLRNIILVAFRNFSRKPGHSALHVSGLTAGFVCAFLISVWVLQQLSYDTFHKDKERIFHVLTHVKSQGTVQTFDVATTGLDVSSVPEAEAMVSVSTGDRWPHELCFRPENDPSECVYFHGVYATPTLFTAFTIPVLIGDKNPLRGPGDIAISEKMATQLFGTIDVIGKTMKVDDKHEVKIVSVFNDLPVNSTLRFDFTMPFALLGKEWGLDEEGLKKNTYSNTYIKTREGTTAGELTGKLNSDRVLSEQYKKEGVYYEAFPFTDWRLHSKFEDGKNTGGRIEYVRIFVIIGLLVVLMAVINFVNLTTARASTRAKEIGIRKVTGAFRSGIILQFIGESFFLVSTAVVLAAILTQISLPVFGSLVGEEISITLLNGHLILYLFLFMLIVAVAAGFYPALVLSSFQPVKILKNQHSGIAGSNTLRKSLLAIQLSVSLGIIIFSAVLYRQLNFVANKDLGFDRHNMIQVEPTFRLLKQLEPFRNELAKAPSIIGLTNSNSNPLASGGGNTGVSWQGKHEDSRIAFTTVGCTYDFPKLFGLSILEGRDFLPRNSDTVNTEVLVTYEAAKTMGFEQPVGQHFTIAGSPCVIIGVVNDFHTNSLHQERLPVILHRISEFNGGRMYIKYQPGQLKEAMEALQEAYKKFEPAFTMRYTFLDETFDDLYKTEATASSLVVIFTIISLIIAIIGILGLATYNVMRKTKEIGVRRVFGASVAQVLTMLTKEFSTIMIVSVLIAAPAAWYVANEWLSGFAYHTEMPWWVFVISFAGIAGLTVIIICAQALKTINVNPTETLRSE